jgi:hypothetical protein
MYGGLRQGCSPEKNHAWPSSFNLSVPAYRQAKKTPPSMQGKNNQSERAPKTQFDKATSIGVEYGACTVMPHFSDKRGKRASPGYAWSFFP